MALIFEKQFQFERKSASRYRTPKSLCSYLYVCTQGSKNEIRNLLLLTSSQIMWLHLVHVFQLVEGCFSFLSPVIDKQNLPKRWMLQTTERNRAKRIHHERELARRPYLYLQQSAYAPRISSRRSWLSNLIFNQSCPKLRIEIVRYSLARILTSTRSWKQYGIAALTSS